MSRSGMGVSDCAFSGSFLEQWPERTFVRLHSSAGGNMKRGFPFVLFALVLFLSCTAAFAQVDAAEAQLNGSVRAQTGSVVVKAAVTLRQLDTNHIYRQTSNSE